MGGLCRIKWKRIMALVMILFLSTAAAEDIEQEERSMAALYRQDIINIELNSGSLHRSFLRHSIGSGDAGANRFGMRVYRDGQPVDLTGVSCQGYFRNSRGENIALTSHGTVSGNLAYVTLPQACYNYEGVFCLSIKLVGGGVTGTMRIVDGNVDNTNTGGAVAPTGSVPTYQEVLALYNDVLDIDETAMINRGIGESSCDDLTTEGIYFCSYSQGTKSIEDFPYDAGWLIVTTIGDQTMQYAIEWAEHPASLIRERQHDVWKDWCPSAGNAFNVDRANIIYNDDPVSADDITDGGVYFSSGSGGSGGITDLPFSTGWLIVSPVLGGNPLYLQIAYPYHSTDEAYYRVCNIDGVWGSWREMGSGGGGTTIENTYNITCSPQITTDSNGWLQAVDTDTESETSKTDMTAAIMAMLNSTGYCHLSPGIFYVSGNIDMPEGATLEGCGENTIIRLLASVTTGYCVRVGKYNTIKDIKFSGAYSTPNPPSSGTLGTRNAIICIANADGLEATQPNVEPNLITGCWFEGFSGSAIYQHNTGGGVRGAITMTDCFIRRCGAGINIDYYSEYCKYNAVITEQCYYACINNGGNNVFTGCTFHGTIGFLMDNSDGDAANPAHGSCIGCTFNHIDNWNHPTDLGGGDAVKIISNPHGFIFSGCQFWYSAIKIKNSRGMTFDGCLIGGNSPVIKVEGSYGAFFHGCTFQNAPSLDVNAATKMTDCFLASDSSAVTP